MNRRLLPLVILFFTNACSTQVVKDSGPSSPLDVSGIADAIPRTEPLSKMGNQSSYVVFGKRYYVLKSAENFRERGDASWYGNKFHGNKTANGETYDMYAMTAAHKRLPLPSYVRVTNLNNHRSVIVRVNDRGPFHHGRIIDLSYAAATKLGIDKVGIAPVEIVTVTTQRPPQRQKTHQHQTIAVQVGAFSFRATAEKVSRELRTFVTVAVSISEVYKQGKKLFRVRVGPFDNAATASWWMRKLNAMSYDQVIMVYLQ